RAPCVFYPSPLHDALPIYYGDATITVPVGEIKPEAQRLLDVCRESLEIGIDQARAGQRLTDISAAIQRHVESHGFSVIRDLYGRSEEHTSELQSRENLVCR